MKTKNDVISLEKDRRKVIAARLQQERKAFKELDELFIKYRGNLLGKEIPLNPANNNLSVENLAMLLGCSKRLVLNWEKGESVPSYDYLHKLSILYQCDIAYLLGEIDCKHHEVASICQETGLTEKNVEFLRHTKLDDDIALIRDRGNNYLGPDCLEFVNVLLENVPQMMQDIGAMLNHKRDWMSLLSHPQYENMKKAYLSALRINNAGRHDRKQYYFDELDRLLNNEREQSEQIPDKIAYLQDAMDKYFLDYSYDILSADDTEYAEYRTMRTINRIIQEFIDLKNKEMKGK